jgi:hypothetical protein
MEKRLHIVNGRQLANEKVRTCGPRPYHGIAGPRPETQVQVGETATRHMQESQRTVVTDFDGHASYGNWNMIRAWTA